MTEKQHYLEILLEGAAVENGRISIDNLLRLLSEFKKAIERTGTVLQGEMRSDRPGTRPKSLKQEVDLDLVFIGHGSPATRLGFERQTAQICLPGEDFGAEVFEKFLLGLEAVQREDGGLPPGFDKGVLMAVRDAGIILQKGVSAITFTLNHRDNPVRVGLDPEGFQNLQKRIIGPTVNMRTIEGRLLMADFKEKGTRCRVHPSAGEPVLCLFSDEQKDEVLDNMLHFVRVIGEAKEDPATGRIATIRIADIERLEDREGHAAGYLPEGTALPVDFWSSLTLEDLAMAQGVRPVAHVSSLYGSWPGGTDDGFEDEIRDLRQQCFVGGQRQ